MRYASRSRIRSMSLWIAAVLASSLAPMAAHPERGPQQASPGHTIPPALDEAVNMVFSDFRARAEYEYVMTGKVRILLFWVGRDDVGDGRISVEEGIERAELAAIRLRIGSDPAKAPRRINRWGAAAEVIERDAQTRSVVSTAFFGFMKATEGRSVEAVEAELESEGSQRRHVFEASINRIERGAALSSVLPIVSPVDFHSGQLAQAEQMVRAQYERAFRLSSYRQLDGAGRSACARNESFLFTLKDVIDAAVVSSADGLSRCFVYNSKLYTLRLARQRPVARRKIAYRLIDDAEVQHDYRDLLQLRFETRNQQTGWTEHFDLLVGTTGNIAGVPVQITYQPNFWFKAILNLHRVRGASGRTVTEPGR